MIRKTLLIIVLINFGFAFCYGQAKKPSLMVVPSDAWCVQNGYIRQSLDETANLKVYPDYQKALSGDMDLLFALSKISGIMQQRGFPPKNLEMLIKQLSFKDVESAMIQSNSTGAKIRQTSMDRLYEQSKADIILHLGWKLNAVGPRKSITFNLLAVDNYTGKEVASAAGTGEPSYTAELPILLEEAVLMHMDNFCALLQCHFDEMFRNGREVVVEIKIFNDGSDLSFEAEYGEITLEEVIDNYMYKHAEQRRFNKTIATETQLVYNPIHIPLYDKQTNHPLDTKSFVRGLQRYLSVTYDISSKIYSNGLGRAVLVIGE